MIHMYSDLSTFSATKQGKLMSKEKCWWVGVDYHLGFSGKKEKKKKLFAAS